MLFTLVICTWVDRTKEDEQFRESSNCSFYTILLESLCKKANSTPGYFNNSNPPPVECFASTSYLQTNMKQLENLAYAACKLIFSFERETSIVFSDITLSNYFCQDDFTVCKTFALKTGILTNRKDKSRTGRLNSFIHITVQEFLAAYHIACNTHVIDDVVVGYLKRYNDFYLDLSQVFIFLCGMNTVASNALSGLMNECHVSLVKCCMRQDVSSVSMRKYLSMESGRQQSANKLAFARNLVTFTLILTAYEKFSSRLVYKRLRCPGIGI
ncbi:hypothetical protein DPMN_086346 [Dreissena polymorpha]|uniref:Uncharacterized protein n=1 Tax=Dreissena polymorpha TaxID=45954 RepID=A0A9D4QVV8_DREPO|nr:hypothetical protein DPMN_086346 [Dreissena polymorpha]